MKLTLTSVIRTACPAAAALAMIACSGNQAETTSLKIPRGETISVRTSQPIRSDAQPGASFATVLDSPLTQGAVIYVPLEATVDGEVVEWGTTTSGQREVFVRAVRLHLPGGKTLPLDTAEISRSARSTSVAAAAVSARTGIEDKIRYLAETGDASPPPDTDGTAPSAGTVIIPKDTRLVFSLESELVVPHP